MRKELRVRNKDKYTEIVEWFKAELNLDVPVKLSPFKHRRMIAYYDWKEHKMVMFVHNTKDDMDFVQALAHEMAHVVDIAKREKHKKWNNHHDINFFIEYYRILEMYFGELPTKVWVEFLNELEEHSVDLRDFKHELDGRKIG